MNSEDNQSPVNSSETAAETEVITDSPAETSLETRIQELETQLQAEKDKALRALAEMENFKRRKENELDQLKKFMHEKWVLELLPVMDSFDRAFEQENANADTASGFHLIYKQFSAVLERNGIKAIEALNTAFDPHKHQAILEEDAPGGVAAQTVLKEMQKGYQLHDRVIRPSMVVVSK